MVSVGHLQQHLTSHFSPHCHRNSLLLRYWATLLLGMGGVASVAVLQYGCFVWCSVLLQKKGTDATILLVPGTAGTTGSRSQLLLCAIFGRRTTRKYETLFIYNTEIDHTRLYASSWNRQRTETQSVIAEQILEMTTTFQGFRS